AETQRREARHEARRAQHTQRILGEGGADVAQYALLQVAAAAERIDQAAVGRLCDRVDGEVAAAEVLLQRHGRVGIDDEAAMAAPGFALGACPRVFLVALRIPGHRAVAADRPRPDLRSVRASAYSSLLCGCRNTGKSRPTARNPRASIASGVCPTTTQSRSPSGSPSRRSRTAPPTR